MYFLFSTDFKFNLNSYKLVQTAKQEIHFLKKEAQQAATETKVNMKHIDP